MVYNGVVMANLSGLRKQYSPDEFTMLLSRALELAERNPNVRPDDIQNQLGVGYNPAQVLHDWLVDNHKLEAKISEHWVRMGRLYVQNNLFISLPNMIKQMNVGERRANLIMLELERRGTIKIMADFDFQRLKPMATFEDLVRQMQKFAKKYWNRCEPTLLMRVMYVDIVTACRLAQYGEEKLGMRWKLGGIENYVKRFRA